MELRRIWEIIWRRKWIIIQAFLVISLTAIVGSFLTTPIYETSAKVLIKTSDTASSLLSSIGLQDFSSLILGSETETETYVALATIRPVLDTVISKLQLRTSDGDLMKADDLQNWNVFLNAIFSEPRSEITQVEDTDLFEIKARGPDPEETAMIANTLAEIYIEENLKYRKEEYRSARRFIDDQIKLVRAGYREVLGEIKRFKIREKTVDLEKETKIAIEKIAELMKEKEDNIIDISETRAKLETLKAQLGRQSETIVSGSAISENPQIGLLKKALSDLELLLAGMSPEKRPGHPDVVALKQKIKKARAGLKAEMDIFQESSTDLQRLERELAASEAHLKGVNTDIDKYLPMLYSIPGKALTQSQLELKLVVSQEMYSSLLEYLYQVGIAEAMTLSDIRLVETAAVPDIDEPKSPNELLNGIIGSFLGLVFGFSLGFLVDYLDDTIKNPDEAKELGITLLGTVPKFRRKESHIISQRDPKDPISEAYRTIRNSLKFASLDKPIKSLLITSSMQGEGKSTTVVNLGISIAREGKKVLLVDADLRKPAIHEILEVSNSIGVTTILAGEVKLEDAIKRTEIEGLSILTSGPVLPDPAGMIESAKMGQLIKDLAQQHDIVILDSPPILVTNDSIMLARYVDSSISILESGRITRRAFSQARGFFEQANIQLIGVVLNKFKIQRGEYYYYYYYRRGYYEGKKK
jgi:succinoglycan biosynthesis transport protein ExoP